MLRVSNATTHFQQASPASRGILFMVACCLCFSVMNNLVRLLSPEVHAMQMVFLRNVFSLLLVLPFVFDHRIRRSKVTTSEQCSRSLRGAHEAEPLNAKTKKPLKLFFWRSACGWVAMMGWFYSLTILPVATVTALGFTTPIFVSILAMIFLHERPNSGRIMAVLIGFCGALIILRPGPDFLGFGAIITLFAAFMMAVSGILIKKLTRTESALTMLFAMTCIMTPLSAPAAFMHWQWLTWPQWGIAFALATCSITGQYFLTRSHAETDLTVLLPFDFTRLLFSALIATWWFAEIPDALTLLGGTVILACAVFAVWNERRRPPIPPTVT